MFPKSDKINDIFPSVFRGKKLLLFDLKKKDYPLIFSETYDYHT